MSRDAPLRVVHVSAHDASGGAARACFNLHTALKRLGHRSTIVAAHVTSRDPDVLALPPAPRRRRLRPVRPREPRRPAGWVGYGFTGDRGPADPAVTGAIPPADVVNLHWFGGVLDFGRALDVLTARGPVTWSLHDMNAFTGGCHFDAGCGRFTAACGACPQIASTADDDLSRAVWRRKRAALGAVAPGRLALVTPSAAFAAEAARSSLLAGLPITPIRYAVDTGVFRARDRRRARVALGIAPEEAVVGFVADSLATRRKGFRFVEAAARELAQSGRSPLLLTIGANDPGPIAGVRRVHVDFIDDDDRLADAYTAMDVVLVPSLQESMGFTALEALACERPVVAFEGGPLPEVVRPGQTGEIVALGDASGLARAVARLLDDAAERVRLGRGGRRLVQEECRPERHASRYVDVYRGLLDARAG